MKNHLWLLIGLSLIFTLAVNASAAVQISKSELILPVDYTSFEQEDQESVRTFTESFTLTNSGTESGTFIITLTGLPSGYNPESKTITINPNESQTLSLFVDVPHQEDSGKSNIGILSISQNNAVVASIPVKQDTMPMLQMDRIEVEFIDEDGERQTERFSENQNTFSIDPNILIGTSLKLTFKVENLFDRDYDEDKRDLQDIEVSIEPSEDELFPADTPERYEVGTLDAKESKEMEIILPLDVDADTGDYTIDITIEGEDGEGAKHILEKELTFEIIRKREDVRITKAQFSPATLSCGRETSLAVELTNFGARDQELVGLNIFNEELAIRKNVADLKLEQYSESGNSLQENFKFIIPSDLRQGTYYVDLTAFVKRDVVASTERVALVLQECTAEEENNLSNLAPLASAPSNSSPQPQPSAPPAQADSAAQDDENNESGDADTDNVAQPITSSVVAKTVEKAPFAFEQNTIWLGAMLMGVILILGVDVLLITLLMKH